MFSYKSPGLVVLEKIVHIQSLKWPRNTLENSGKGNRN